MPRRPVSDIVLYAIDRAMVWPLFSPPVASSSAIQPNGTNQVQAESGRRQLYEWKYYPV